MAGEGSTVSVTSPVAGSVTLFMVDDGAQVEEEEQILAVEAMKTLFYINAPCAGIVRIKCGLGDIVKRGQIICYIQSN